MSVLSDEEARVLANMAGLLNDEEAQKRIADIRAAAAEHDKALSRLKVKQAEIEQLTREANQKISDAATMAANAEARHRELNQREATMREVADAMNAEKKAFEEVRTKVGAEQRAMGKALDDRDARLTDLEKKATDMAHDYWARLAETEQLKASLEAKHKRLRDALEANEA